AEALLRRVMAMRQRNLPRQHPQQGVVRSMLGMVLFARGKGDEASRLIDEAVAIMRAAFQEPHFFFALTLANQGMVLAGLGQLPAAEAALVESAHVYEQAEGKNHEWADVRASLAAIMM